MAEKRRGVDEFLNYSTRAGGGAYLAGWKEDGKITVWLHTVLFAAPAYLHNVPHVVERKSEEKGEDKELAVMGQRWICHESDEVLKRQYFYDKETGEREYPPQVCPMCMVTEEVRRLYRAGKIGWCDPVFEWKGDGKEDLVILAGGLDGSFNMKDPPREKVREMRLAGVRRDESFKQDLRPKLKFLFCVVDDADLEAGVQKAWEGKALGEKLKKAVRDEIKRAKCKADPEGTAGNPTVNPYPFQWEYDDSKDFSDKFDILALTKEQPTEEVLRLIRGPAPDVDRDLQPGNCFSLRVELEEHCVLKKGLLDFDRCFAPAAKAGLMAPPEESKPDAEAEEPERAVKGARAPEVRGAEPARLAIYLAKVQLGTSSPAWKDEDWKPGTNVRGVEVVLDVPDEVSDARVGAVKKLLREAGAVSVVMRVACDHCGEVMTTADPDCPSCGARYDDDGKLTSRPCTRPECEGQCPLEGDGPSYICEKCGTVHAFDADKLWAAKEPAREEPARRRRVAEEPAAKDDRKRGVPFDQPRK